MTTERDGIRFSVQLDRDPLPSGEATWLTASVMNLGADDVVWFHDGCGTLAGVWGSIDAVTLRLGHGHDATGADFKLRLLQDAGLERGVPTVWFIPDAYVGKGRYLCADVGIEERIRPGQTVSQRAQWNGGSGLGLAPAPSGHVTLTAGFRYFWRAGAGMPSGIAEQVLELSLETSVVNGRDRSLLDPGEAIDAALDAPAFAAWLATIRIADGDQPVLRYDAAGGRWEVGVVDSHAGIFHLVTVDPATGSTGPLVERPWDSLRDGNP